MSQPVSKCAESHTASASTGYADQASGSPPIIRKPTVVYACSGSTDAGELADRTARRLAQTKIADMSCLAGIGGRVQRVIARAECADQILVIDGCPMNCAKRTLEFAGFQHFRHLELHQLGFQKGACPVTPERIAVAVDAAVKLILHPGPAKI